MVRIKKVLKVCDNIKDAEYIKSIFCNQYDKIKVEVIKGYFVVIAYFLI